MHNFCHFVRENFKHYRAGTMADEMQRSAIECHLDACPRCRSFAYGQSVCDLLKQSRELPAPVPSSAFFAGLNAKISTAEAYEKKNMFADGLARAGWRLVPALTAVLLCLAGLSGYFVRGSEPESAGPGIEELLILDDSGVSADVTLAVVVLDEVYTWQN